MFFSTSFTVTASPFWINGVSLLTCSIAAGSAHCTISKQRSVFPVIEELGEDFSLLTL